MIEEIREGLYVRRGKGGGYKQVFPLKKIPSLPFRKDNINWKNLLLGGSWENFAKVFGILILILLCAYAYRHDMAGYYKILDDPYAFCANVTIDPVVSIYFAEYFSDMDFSEIERGEDGIKYPL